MAAAWDTAHTTAGLDDAAGMAEFLDVIERVGSQLAGLRLNTIDQARYLSGAAQILDSVTSSTADNVRRLRSHIRLAAVLAEELPLIQAALQEGLISMPQAAAIADGLTGLPAGFGRVEREKCQTEVLKYADTLGPAELRVLAARLVEYVDPEGAEAAEAARLAAQERRARRRRRLRLTPDHHGSMTITGRLPLADGALLVTQLEALMPPLASYQQTGELPDRQARTADALMLLAQIAANSGHLPNQGMDRPHVVLTMQQDTLASGLGHITLPGQAGKLGAGDARRLACDAGILPVVLGTGSQPLDVGREARLFTKPIRAALTLRDGGCVFPGCTAVPAACEAHHIIPWWTGGHTALTNSVLLCPHHHRLVEPDPNSPEVSQWRVHLDPATGQPWFTPPAHIDPNRRPRQHRRHLLAQIKLEPGADDDGVGVAGHDHVHKDRSVSGEGHVPREESAQTPDSLPWGDHADWDDHAQTGKRGSGEEYAHTTASAAPPRRRAEIPAALLDNDWNNHQPDQPHHTRAAALPPIAPLPGQPGYTNPWHTH